MTQWLKTSFWGLPSKRCRHMFLDAAMLLRGQPLQDLRFAWIAMVQFDDGLTGGAAARCVDACLTELVTSSLVSTDDDIPQQHPWDDVPHLVQRCVVTFTPVLDVQAASWSCTTTCHCDINSGRHVTLCMDHVLVKAP